MRLAPPYHRAYTYKVTEAPAKQAVSISTFKAHIKRSSAKEDKLLKLYLNTAITFAEKLMRRDLITRTYETYRDFFPAAVQNEGYYPCGVIPSVGRGVTSTEGNVGFEIRKSPLQSIESITYTNADNVLTTVDNIIYYNTLEEDYSEVLLVEDKCWPDDAQTRQQVITITFKSGFGDSDEDIPADIQRAILSHATSLWKNRGDCDGAGCNATLPADARAIYLQNRIENL